MGNISTLANPNGDSRRLHLSTFRECYPYSNAEERKMRLGRCFEYFYYAYFSSSVYSYKRHPPLPLDLDYAAMMTMSTKLLGSKRTSLMKIIEERILPPDLGKKLELVAYLSPDDDQELDFLEELDIPGITELSRGGSGSEEPSECEEDGEEEDSSIMVMAMSGLENILRCAPGTNIPEGFTPSMTYKVLKIMFQCCTARGNTNEPASTVELIQLIYSLGLACSLLMEEASVSLYEHQREHHTIYPSMFFPCIIGKEHELVQSLLKYDEETDRLNGTFFNGGYDPSLYGRPMYDCNSSSMNVKSKCYKETEGMVSFNSFWQWANTTLPYLVSCFETFIHYAFFSEKEFPSSRTMFHIPILRQNYPYSVSKSSLSLCQTNQEKSSSDFFSSCERNSPIMFTLACMSPSLIGTWCPLYLSDIDGLSFNNLKNALFKFSGPTLLMIHDANYGGLFGGFTSTPWKNANIFYGTSDCFLFRLKPSVALYSPSGSDLNFMYSYDDTNMLNDKLARGIGFGGFIKKPRLFISETLNGCMATSRDSTFEAGPLLPDSKDKTIINTNEFIIQSIEVWGME